MGGKIGASGKDYQITAAQRVRFFKKIQRDKECWIWTSNIVPVKEGDGTGYPLFRLDSKTQIYAHRVSWMMHRGPIPLKAKIRRTCGKNLCVNPAHLEMFYVKQFTPKNKLKKVVAYEPPSWLQKRAKDQ